VGFEIIDKAAACLYYINGGGVVNAFVFNNIKNGDFGIGGTDV